MHAHHHLCRATLAACGLLIGQLAWAQSTPAPAVSPASAAAPQRKAPARGRINQRVERLHFEDAGSRVDELRVGGQTQRITVQPKASVPAYEVQPPDTTGTSAGRGESGPGSAGRRVWKLRQF